MMPGEKNDDRLHTRKSDRKAVECVAYDHDSSIGEAVRKILDAGIAALCIEVSEC